MTQEVAWRAIVYNGCLTKADLTGRHGAFLSPLLSFYCLASGTTIIPLPIRQLYLAMLIDGLILANLWEVLSAQTSINEHLTYQGLSIS